MAPEPPRMVETIQFDPDGGMDPEVYYYVALTMLLHERGGSFTFDSGDYDRLRLALGGYSQIVVTQRDDRVKLELMRDNQRRH